MKEASGTIYPVEDTPDVSTDGVSFAGTIETLWEPSSPKIEQVGLIANYSERINFTGWMKSEPRIAHEG